MNEWTKVFKSSKGNTILHFPRPGKYRDQEIPAGNFYFLFELENLQVSSALFHLYK